MTNKAASGIVIVTIVWAVIVMAFMLNNVWGADFTPPARWGDPVDSAKLFVTLADGTHWDSTAGAARTNVASYDTTITGLSNDTAYLVIFRLWDADSGKDWTFYWPILSTATISDATIGKIVDSTDSILSDAHGADSWLTGGAGSGDNDVRIYAIDTSGTDDSIMGVKITVKTIAGVFDAAQTTNSNGYRDFTLPTDSMKYLGSKAGYRWITDTINVTGDDTVDIYGYNIPLQASPDPNLCRVQGYVFVSGGKTERKITVTFTNDGGVYNSCDSTAFIPEPVTTRTDTSGFFYADLIPSGCLLKSNGDSLQYTINASLDDNTIKEKLIWVPQSDSLKVVW